MADSIRKPSEQLGRLLEEVSDAVVATRRNGDIVYANAVAARWFDRAPHAFVNLHLSDLDIDLARRDWRVFRADATARPPRPRRLKTVNGAPVDVELRHRVFGDVDVWFFRPAADSPRLDGAASATLFRALSLPQLIVDAADGCILDVNSDAEAFYGLDAATLMRRTLGDLTDPSSARLPLELEQALDARGSSFRCAQRFADGTWRSVRLHAVGTHRDGAPLLHLLIHDVHDTLALNHELSAYRDLIERLPIGVFRTMPSGDGRILMANQALCDILDVPSDEALVGTSASRFYAQSGDRRRLIREVEQTDDITRGVHALVTRSGRRIWAAITGRRVRDEHGRLLFEGAMEDITDRVDAEASMRQAARIIENAREGITITDADANILSVNPSFTRITGYSLPEVIGRNPRILSSGRQSDAFYRQMWREIGATDHWQGEIWNRRKNGEIYPQWLTISAIRDEAGNLTNYAAVFTDLTEIHRSQAELERMQRQDSLTGLLNRSEFLRRLEREVQRAATEGVALCLVVLGIDEFTRINNVYSFGVGDDVLGELGHRFARCLEHDAVLAGRTNSDEFALLFRHSADLSSVDGRATELIELAREPIRIHRTERLALDVSAGVGLFPAHARAAGRLLGHAEAALGYAKKRNRGGYQVFEPDLEVAEERRVWLKQELAKALDRGQLTVAYQPIVEVASGRIVGAEALARWHHPDEGWIRPDEFIALAEDGGLIDRLTFDLLETACGAVAGIRRRVQSSLGLSFNISTLQLADPHLPARTLAILERTGLAARSFRMELTESRLMVEIQHSLQCIRDLQQAGIMLSIDDFGTGFSSLAYLQEIRPRTLKIDRRFIRNLPSDRQDAAIATTIVAMAHALGMEVVAEGVETGEQLDYLARAGCEYYQGYLCSAPLSAEDFERLLVDAAT